MDEKREFRQPIDHADSREEAWNKAADYAEMLTRLQLQNEWRVRVEPHYQGGYNIILVEISGEEEAGDGAR